MSAEYDFSCELVSLRGFGSWSSGCLRDDMCGVVVVLRDRVDDGLFDWLRHRSRSFVYGLLECEVSLEECCQLIMRCHCGRKVEARSRL